MGKPLAIDQKAIKIGWLKGPTSNKINLQQEKLAFVEHIKQLLNSYGIYDTKWNQLSIPAITTPYSLPLPLSGICYERTLEKRTTRGNKDHTNGILEEPIC